MASRNPYRIPFLTQPEKAAQTLVRALERRRARGATRERVRAVGPRERAARAAKLSFSQGIPADETVKV